MNHAVLALPSRPAWLVVGSVAAAQCAEPRVRVALEKLEEELAEADASPEPRRGAVLGT